jgi:putative transposase
LVDKDSYLLEVTRYVVLNPVRAGMVKHPGEYRWSSYKSMIGEAATPEWLATDGLLSLFSKQRAAARRRYSQFVSDGHEKGRLWDDLRQQIYLGDEGFIEKMQKQAVIEGDDLNIPLAQRRAPAPTLDTITKKHPKRDKAIVAAYATGAYSYRELANYFNLHLSTIGRIVRNRMQQ